MLFNSLEFLIFFPFVVLLYFVIPNKGKNIWLLIASYFFYMCWNAKYTLLILFSTIVTFFSGILLEKVKLLSLCERKTEKYKKVIVGSSIFVNLVILFYFKYFNFAFASIANLFRLINVELNVPVIDVVLPVGISFYTFQALGYMIDVYRGEIYAEKSFCNYALFVSFFPQLVAGPIERSKNLIKQLSKPQKFLLENFLEGLLLMLWGFFLKIVLADRIAIFVDTVYGEYVSCAGWYFVVATVLFAIQIYCDFYGYSIIAIGSAKILGIQLMENFQAPYFAISVDEFWRRWHISLTSWFKDYLYIPLGGNRKGKRRKLINKMLVFTISGLWHGAQFTYVIWGGLNGLYQVVGEVCKPIRDRVVRVLRIKRELWRHKLFKGIITFILIDFTWIFFRAERIRMAFDIIKSIFTECNITALLDMSWFSCGLDKPNFILMIIGIMVLVFADICKYKQIAVRNLFLSKGFVLQSVVIAVSIWAILIWGIWGPSYDAANFIYFQF